MQRRERDLDKQGSHDTLRHPQFAGDPTPSLAAESAPSSQNESSRRPIRGVRSSWGADEALNKQSAANRPISHLAGIVRRSVARGACDEHGTGDGIDEAVDTARSVSDSGPEALVESGHAPGLKGA